MTFPHNADLHCHSTASDGVLQPEELAALARERGVDLWSLTDHDELAGQGRAAAAARQLGIRYLTGVEISVTFANTAVHIVGLGIDAQNPLLIDHLTRTRSWRDQRAKAMAERLADLGIPGAYEGALRFSENPRLIGRNHFARYLVQINVCKDTNAAFKKYLGDGKSAFVPQQWAHLDQAVCWIRDAGGVAVLAHPARYRFSPIIEDDLLSQFKSYGGQAIEVVTGNHSAQEASRYAEIARQWDLAASRGSDFHSAKEGSTPMGDLEDLPADLRPVWTLLHDRIQ